MIDSLQGLLKWLARHVWTPMRSIWTIVVIALGLLADQLWLQSILVPSLFCFFVYRTMKQQERDFASQTTEATGQHPPQSQDKDACEEQEETNEVLNGISLALCKVNSDLKIEPGFNEFFAELFDVSNLNNANLIDLLFKESNVAEAELRSFGFNLKGVYGLGELQWNLSKSFLLEECQIKTQKGRIHVRIQYVPFYVSGKITRIAICINDISHWKQLEESADQRQKDMERLFSLVSISEDIFNQYLDETSTLFDRIKKDLRMLRKPGEENYLVIVDRMFRDVHTIKGNSRLFNFNFIQDVAHRVESHLHGLRDQSIDFDADAISKLTEDIMELNEEIYSYTSTRREVLGQGEKQDEFRDQHRLQWTKTLIQRFSQAISDPNLGPEHIAATKKSLNSALASFKKSSLQEYLTRYQGLIQELAEQLNKKVRPLKTCLEYKYLDKRLLTHVNSILLHLIRNAIDHGIELPEERLQAGKDEAGTITITTRETTDGLLIEFCDDGRGIDGEKLFYKARSSGILTPETQEMSDHNKAELIFLPGLSSKSDVSDLSGRGVGMDAVKDIIENLGGRIELASTPNQGTTFKIHLTDHQERILQDLTIIDLKMLFNQWAQELRLVLDLPQFEIAFADDDGDATTSFHALADSKLLGEAFRMLTLEVVRLFGASPNLSLKAAVTAKKGRRHRDSDCFFRLDVSISTPNANPLKVGFTDTSGNLARAHTSLAKRDGSVIVRSPAKLEINIPSLLRCGFSESPVKIMILLSDREPLELLIRQFFQEMFPSWRFQISTELTDVNKDDHDWWLVVCEESSVEKYSSTRAAGTKRDGILLYTEIGREAEVIQLTSRLDFEPVFIENAITEQDFFFYFQSMMLRCLTANLRVANLGSSEEGDDEKQIDLAG